MTTSSRFFWTCPPSPTRLTCSLLPPFMQHHGCLSLLQRVLVSSILSQFQVAIKWWLGLEVSYGSSCPLCPEIALDSLGHHAVTYKRGGDGVFRHNKLRDVLAESCRQAHLGVQVEMGSNVTSNHSLTRPADLFGSKLGQQLLTCRSHPRLIPQFFLKRV